MRERATLAQPERIRNARRWHSRGCSQAGLRAREREMVFSSASPSHGSARIAPSAAVAWLTRFDSLTVAGAAQALRSCGCRDAHLFPVSPDRRIAAGYLQTVQRV